MRRSWRFTAAVAVVLAAASMLMSAVLFMKIQDERELATVDACLRDSGQSKAIITFLESLGAEPETLTAARVFFPVLTREQCEARAERYVGPPPASP